MSQASFRLPRELAWALTRLARVRRVPKSQLVREALEQYLSAAAADAPSASAVRERSAPYVGAVKLSTKTERDDSVAALIRARNWRE